MLRCDTCAVEEVPACAFTVVFARYRDGWLFSRHRARDTWETQGGHVDPGETPEAAARRELYEESGAHPIWMMPVCGYWAARDGAPRRYGIVYLAEIARLDALPDSEMAEVRWFDTLPAPERLTYPDITPRLFVSACDALRQVAMEELP